MWTSERAWINYINFDELPKVSVPAFRNTDEPKFVSVIVLVTQASAEFSILLLCCSVIPTIVGVSRLIANPITITKPMIIIKFFLIILSCAFDERANNVLTDEQGLISQYHPGRP